MKDTIKNIRNRFIVILALLLFTAGSMRAQVFIFDEEAEGNIRLGTDEFVVPVPYQGGDLDEYVPIGSGWLLLAGMGGAYLIGKRRKE